MFDPGTRVSFRRVFAVWGRPEEAGAAALVDQRPANPLDLAYRAIEPRGQFVLPGWGAAADGGVPGRTIGGGGAVARLVRTRQAVGGVEHFLMDLAQLVERLGGLFAEIGHEPVAAGLQLGEQLALPRQALHRAARADSLGRRRTPVAWKARPGHQIARAIELGEHLFGQFGLATPDGLGAPGAETAHRRPAGDRRRQTGRQIA